VNHKDMDINWVLPKDMIVLTVQIDKKGNHIIRNYAGGFINESYRHMNKDEAVIAMTSLICGFQPPRIHHERDIPFPEIESESLYQTEVLGESTLTH